MPHLSTYVGLADRSEEVLAASLRTVAAGHAHVSDVFHTCLLLADLSDSHRERLRPVADRYGEDRVEEPDRLHAEALPASRAGDVGLLRDLQDLHLSATLVQTTWTAVLQAAQGLRDRQLIEVATAANGDTSQQLAWLVTRMKEAAPQALIVSP
jgi:hypothetical protein